MKDGGGVDLEKKYDIGLTGLWFAKDYGNAISCYMLYRTLQAAGKSVLMIAPDSGEEDAVVSGFAKEVYRDNRFYLSEGIDQVNQMCRAFAVGGGQVWNYGIAKSFETLFYLGFADSRHPRMALCSSFGHMVDFVSPEARKRVQENLSKFSLVYVREPHMKGFLKGTYDIGSETMLDPLLWNPVYLKELEEKSELDCNPGTPYILLHLLDDNEAMVSNALEFSKRAGCRLLVIKNTEAIKEEHFMDVVGAKKDGQLSVYDFMRVLGSARYVITDSYSTSCISIALKKNIISLVNSKRGSVRFINLFHRLGMEYFLLEKESDLQGIRIDAGIDYKKMEEFMLRKEREVLHRQLERALMLSSAKNIPKRKAGETAWERRSKYYEMLTHRPVVLLGGGNTAVLFCKAFGHLVNIRRILTNYRSEIGREISAGTENPLKVSEYKKSEIQRDDFIIVCRGDLQNFYKDAKECLDKDGFSYGKDYISAKLANTILNRKKVIAFVGYCQLDVMRDVFNRIGGITSEFDVLHFRLGSHTLQNSHKYSEYIEYVKISDILVYTSLFSFKGKSDVNFLDLLADDARRCSLPRLAFRGLHPYKADNLETFHELTRYREHVHWPFIYEEPIIDSMILEGKPDDQICNELMDEGLIPEGEIQKNFDLACKSIAISEKIADIKMLDYIKENYRKRMLYRDCLHYQNCMYFEIARRISKKLNLYLRKEIDELESKLEKEGKHFIDFTEIPILPCVAKALGIEYATDEKKYRVRNFNGTIQEMTRKEWIHSYCEYTKSIMSVKKFFEK